MSDACAAIRTRYDVEIGGRTFIIEGPPAPDELVRAAVSRGEIEPAYWAHLWPSALALARHAHGSLLVGAGARCLEIGCGLGLVGIVAAARGASVTLTDVAQEAVDAARRNAALNGVHVEAARFDWRDEPGATWAPDVVLGADVLYRRESHAPIAQLLRKLGATALLADPHRPVAGEAEALFRSEGLAVWSAPAAGARIMVVQAR